MLNWRNTRPPRFAGESEISTMFKTALDITCELGFETCSFSLNSTLQTNDTRNVRINNHSNEWNKIYKQEKYAEIDPILVHCKNSLLPLVWDEKSFPQTAVFWSQAQYHGLKYGWSQAVHDFNGIFSVLTLGRTHSPVGAEELYEKAGQVLWLCHAMHTVVAKGLRNAPEKEQKSKLTCREIEVLKWCAQGKTAAETAKILVLSERTIGFHVKSAMDKLGAQNKTCAVLRAAKAGLL